MQLRKYQRNAIDDIYTWFKNHKTGHPVINMPGGSGKSVVIATFVKEALQQWPQTRVLMVVHSRELVRQNAAKLRVVWPGAPMGVYSAGLNKKQLGEPITFAGIQSVRNRASSIGHIDLCLIDEVHAVSATQNGTYRKFLNDLFAINPNIRLIGFTASPYRMGHGMITDGKDALFSDILEPVSIEELVYLGYLAPLKSKRTDKKLDTKGLKVRMGEYVAKDMQAQFNTDDNNAVVVSETIERAKDRKHWLFFCSGVEHCMAIVAELERNGIPATYVESGTPKKERDRRIAAFEASEYRAMCNVGILTTGWDFPALDCIVFLRSTKSPGLYLQSAVRGMRIHPGKENCLVLDFAGVVQEHGPITNVTPPPKKGEKAGTAPVKDCPECGEILHASVMTCPECGYIFPKEEKTLKLHNDDIMGDAPLQMNVKSWGWRKHTSRTSGKSMLVVTYYGALSDKPVTEYLTVAHDGYAGMKALRTLASIVNSCKIPHDEIDITKNDLSQAAHKLEQAQPPAIIEYKMAGKFPRILNREWIY